MKQLHPDGVPIRPAYLAVMRRHLWVLLGLVFLVLAIDSYRERLHEGPDDAISTSIVLLLVVFALLSHIADRYVRAKRLRWTLNALALGCLFLAVWFRLHLSA